MSTTTTGQLSTADYNTYINSLTDQATGRLSIARINASPDSEKDAVVRLLISQKRPIIAAFVTKAMEPELEKAGYQSGYHTMHFAYWILPVHAGAFTRSQVDTVVTPPVVDDVPPAPPAPKPRPERSAEPKSAEVVDPAETQLLQQVGSRIRELRESHVPTPAQVRKLKNVGREVTADTVGISQEQLAHLVGIPRTRMTALEKGNVNMVMSTLYPVLRELKAKLSIDLK
ncbi:MAG TPA: helix-turn-helix transcriptional regulator [Fibrella sp.]|jgi:DNA-binding XRE family transcriptional regulator